MDEFQVHLMATSLNAIKDCGTAVDFICGGYTSKLSSFGRWSKQALGFVRNSYEDWMVAHPHGTKVKRQDVAQWVWTAWLRVFTINKFEDHLECGWLSCKQLMTLFYSKSVACD
jgi:hypothetical protein